jgi:hypothetical protein
MAKGNTAAMPGMDKDWMAEGDLRTLIEAEKIKKDKPRYAAAMKKCKQMAADMAAVHEAGKDKGEAGEYAKMGSK